MPKQPKFLVRLLLGLTVFSLSAYLAKAGEPIEIASGVAPQHPQQPQLVVDAKGTAHVVFGVRDTVRYCRLQAGAKHASKSVELPPTHTISLGMRRGPRIAVTDTAICVSVIGGKQGKGRDGDVLAMHSSDGGTTWSEPAQVNDVASSAREGLHAMAAGPKGELACVWLDLRNRKTEVMAATSSDGGGTWSKNTLVYRSPQGSVCECCHPSAVYDSNGRLVVLWRNSLDGARDMYVANSVSGGVSFDKALKLGEGTWTLNACPMDGGAIACLADNTLATVWRRDKSIYLAQVGRQRERLLGAGEQPTLAATEEGSYVAWLTKRGAALQLVSPGETSPVLLAEHASDPVLASSTSGKNPVVAVWESRRGQQHTIMCQVIAP